MKPLYQASSGNADGTIHKLFNSIIEGLNESNILSDYILLLPDRDIILQLEHFHLGIGFVIEQCLNWLAKQLDRALSSRKDALLKRSPGSVGQDTKIIWVDMIN